MSDNEESERSPYLIKLLLLAAAVVVAIVLLWQVTGDEDEPSAGDPPAVAEPQTIPEPTPSETVAEPARSPQQVEPEPEPQAEAEPLPALAQSDEVVRALAREVAPGAEADRLLVGDNVIMKSVRAVIAAAGGNVVHEYRPIASPEGPFLVEKLDEAPDPDVGQRYRLSEENYERYDRYVDVLTSIDPYNLAKTFQRFYPLLDEAYASHGVDRGSFKQVTLNAIDGLLAAPELEEPPVLIQPKVHYQFADKKLESLSGPQKLLIRMGPENTRKVKAALKEIREVIAATELPQPPAQ